MLTLKAVTLNDVIQKPDDLRWKTVRPSGLTCPREIWYHLHKPEVGDPYSWRELKGLSEVGTALHNHLIQKFANEYQKQGFETQMEVEVEGEIEGMKVIGHIDLLLTNPINDNKIVVEFKFLHPNAIYKVFHHHIVQASVYCKLAGANTALLHYISRDLLSDHIHFISQEDIDNAFSYACELIKQANVQSEEQLPPPLNPNDYPCVYRTQRGTAYCPFYKVCHTSWYPTNDAPPNLTEVARRYLELLSQYEEAKALWQPIEAELDELKKHLKSLLQPGQTVVTDIGKVTAKSVQQKRVDLDAVKKFFQSLNLNVPYTTIDTCHIVAEIVYE